MTAIDSGRLGELAPVRVTMGRLAAVIRAGAALLALCTGILGAVPPVSIPWLTVALLVLVGWTAVYAWTTWRKGVRPWATAIDLILTAGLCLAMGKLVPEAALPQGNSWVAVFASMVVIWAQPAGPAWIWVPAGLAVVGCYSAGAHLAGASDGGSQHVGTLTTQVIAAAVVVGIAVRTGRVAARTFGNLQAAQAEAEVLAMRRSDELTQLRLLHNGPLTTLTMAIHTESERPTELLQRRAAANLEQMPKLAQYEPGTDALTRLDERIAQVIVWYEPLLNLSTAFQPSLVPADAAEAFVDAVSECLENVVRHAATHHAQVVLRDDGEAAIVTVTDRGRGFDVSSVPPHHFGLRQLVSGRMAAGGGNATIQSIPGHGSEIVLEWRRD